MDLVIGKIDEADAIIAHNQIRILPAGHIAEVRIFCRIGRRNRVQPGLVRSFRGLAAAVVWSNATRVASRTMATYAFGPT